MKYYISIIILLLGHISFCQINTSSDVIALAKSAIAHPISKFNSSIICAETEGLTNKPIDSAKCSCFRYTPIDSFPFMISTVKCYKLFLITDSLKIINSINLIIQYPIVGYSSYKVNQDFKSIYSYFNNLFGMDGRKNLLYKDEYLKMDGFTWQTNLFKIVLEKTDVAKKQRRKKFSIININIH